MGISSISISRTWETKRVTDGEEDIYKLLCAHKKKEKRLVKMNTEYILGNCAVLRVYILLNTLGNRMARMAWPIQSPQRRTHFLLSVASKRLYEWVCAVCFSFSCVFVSICGTFLQWRRKKQQQQQEEILTSWEYIIMFRFSFIFLSRAFSISSFSFFPPFCALLCVWPCQLLYFMLLLLSTFQWMRA